MKKINSCIRISLTLLMVSFLWTSNVASQEQMETTPVPARAPQGAPQEVLDSPEDDGWVDRSLEWVEEKRDEFSESVGSTAKAIDRYGAEELFNDEDDEHKNIFDPEEINDSYVRLRVTQEARRFQRGEGKIRISAKVDLPNAQRNVKFVFDSDPDDFDSLDDKQRQTNTGSTKVNDLESNAVAGLRFSNDPEKAIKTDFDVGVRLRGLLDPYVRFRIERILPVGESWKLYMYSNSFFYETEGWGSEAFGTFYYAFDRHLVFASVTGGQFLDRQNNWGLLQAFQVSHVLNRNNAIEYQLGVSADTKPYSRHPVGSPIVPVQSSKSNVKPTAGWLRINWLHRLYKDWLYVKVSPEIAFPRALDYKYTPSIYLELEAFFTTSPNLHRIRIDY